MDTVMMRSTTTEATSKEVTSQYHLNASTVGAIKSLAERTMLPTQ